MASIATEKPTADSARDVEPRDPLRHVIHIALAIYLMPVVAIVCAIGGASIVIDKATQLAGRFTIKSGLDFKTGPSRSRQSSRDGVGSPNGRDQCRTRVGP
jgi:hypothetical protein